MDKNELSIFNGQQLPDTLEDLTQFVLVNIARVDAYKLKLRMVDKLSVAQEIRDQTLHEAQELQTAVFAAEIRIGEILDKLPRATGNQYTSANSTQVEKAKTKTETISEMGYSKDEASDYQQMAKNQEIVDRVLREAIASGEIATKSQVMREIAEAKRQAKAENEKLRKALSESEAKRIAAEKNQKKVEVLPDDYEELKDKASRVDGYKKDYQTMRKQYEEMSDKWKKSESEKQAIIDELHKPENEKAESIKRSAMSFCAGISNFIEKYGGYVWLTQEIDNMGSKEREGYIRAINAMDAWVFQMKRGIKEN